MSARMVIALVGAEIAFLAVPTLMDGQAPPAVGTAAPVEILARFNRDVELAAGDSSSVLVVGGADARVAGTVGAVLVLDGTAELLPTARVGHLAVVRGVAVLRDGSTVDGDVQLLDSEMSREPGAAITGTVSHGYWTQIEAGLRTFSLMIGFGIWLAVLMGGLIATAVDPAGVRRAGDTLVNEPGMTLLTAFVLWICAPFAAVSAMTTVVGIPIGLGLFVFVLPALGFLGYLVCGVRLGDAVLRRTRAADAPERPFVAAAAGLTLLPLLGMVPLLGPLMTLLAAGAGAGAVVLAAWRGSRLAAAPARPVPADPRVLAELNEPAAV
jgi:hypothetical protein